jgi:Holliday junction resolvase RusA-like endonuclease
VRTKPVPKARARVATRRFGNRVVAHAYTPKTTADFEMTVRTAALRAMVGMEPLTGALFARVTCVLPIPASWPKRKRDAALAGSMYHTSRPDLDNLKKAVFDAMNGVVFNDDSQVVSDAGEKRYGDEPRVDVFIQELDQ